MHLTVLLQFFFALPSFDHVSGHLSEKLHADHPLTRQEYIARDDPVRSRAVPEPPRRTPPRAGRTADRTRTPVARP